MSGCREFPGSAAIRALRFHRGRHRFAPCHEVWQEKKKKSGYIMQSPYLAKCLAGTWCWLLLLTPFTSWGTEA